MKYFLVIVFLTVMSIACISEAENVSSPEDWTSWEEVFCSKEKKWKLVKDKKGIKVWLRRVEISPIRSFKGVKEYDSNVNAMTALLLDTEYIASWMELTESAEAIRQVSKTEVYRHTVNRLPWPFRPRDCTSLTKTYYYPETGAVVVRFNNKPDLIPRIKGYIRMPIMFGYYMLEPAPDNKVQFTFEAIVEMGGWLPGWFINFWAAQVPHGTFRSVQGAMPLDRYTGNEFDFTKDFAILESPQL